MITLDRLVNVLAPSGARLCCCPHSREVMLRSVGVYDPTDDRTATGELTGLNWSSQHLEWEVFDGARARLGGGGDRPAGDVLTGTTAGSARRAPADVLVGHRSRREEH